MPGGFVDYGEDPRDACLRELEEECNIKGESPELITVAGDPERDPRKHVVSVVYAVSLTDACSGNMIAAGDDADSVRWYDLKTAYCDLELAFDHRELLKVYI